MGHEGGSAIPKPNESGFGHPIFSLGVAKPPHGGDGSATSNFKSFKVFYFFFKFFNFLIWHMVRVSFLDD